VGTEAKKTRPAVVVSNDINNAHSPIVSISPVTSNVKRIYSFEVELPANKGGLVKRSKVMVNQARAVDKIRLMRKIGSLPEGIMKQVDRARKRFQIRNEQFFASSRKSRSCAEAY
jgi:mRNA interferase MazF